MRMLKITQGGFTLSAAIAALLFLHTPQAFAHARWDLNGIVKPRTTATGLKSDPCGGAARTTTPVTFAPGQTLDVTFEETINHASHFRIAFSAANDAGFDSGILLDNILDNMGPEVTTQHLFHARITLPMQTCEACTLQLIQVMTDNPAAPSNYYSCSDIKLANGSGTTPTPTPTPTPVPTPTPSPTVVLKQIAQNLLDDFAVADADKNNLLTLTEAQFIVPSLTLSVFSTLDVDHDGTLSKVDLNATINPAPNQNTNPTGAGSMEWFSLLALLPFGRRRLLKCRGLKK